MDSINNYNELLKIQNNKKPPFTYTDGIWYEKYMKSTNS